MMMVAKSTYSSERCGIGGQENSGQGSEPKWYIQNEYPKERGIEIGLVSVSFQSLPWIVLPNEQSYET
jgi:hypothetical protein